MRCEGFLILLLNFSSQRLQVGLMILDLLQKLGALELFLLERNTKHALLDKLFKVFFSKTTNIVFLKGVDFLLILLFELLLDLFLVKR